MMEIQLFIVLVAYIGHVFAVLSGVYVDNGQNQTVVQRHISTQEKLQFESDMLDVLGLPSKPRFRTFKKVDRPISATQFLLNVYKESQNREEKVNVYNLDNEDDRSAKESDSIMSFLSEDDHINATLQAKGKRLWFNISSVSNQDMLINAELHLFKITREDDDDDEGPFNVTVYQVIKDLKGKERLAFADSAMVMSNYSDWLVFNVSTALASWITFPYTNQGLHISVQIKDESEENAGIIMDERGIVMTGHEDDVNRPFVVAYFRNNGNPSRRLVRDEPTPRQRYKRSEPEVSYNLNKNPFTAQPEWMMRGCQMQSLYVNFRDLKWNDWVVAPDGYAAYFCSGVCDFPLNIHTNATNHAIVQTLVHLIEPHLAPKPCCVPSELTAMSVLYYAEDNTVVLKKFKNMVVKSCGCH